MRQAKRTNEVISAMAVVAEVLGGLQAGGTVFLEKTQEVITLNEVHLAWLDGFRGQFVVDSGDAGVKSENFSRLGDLEDQGFAFGGIHRQLNPALAKHVDTARRLTFNEENSSSRIGGWELDLFEGFEGFIRKRAEEIIRTKFADEAIFNEL